MPHNLHGEYIGAWDRARGESAILRQDPDNTERWLAQWDNLDLGLKLTHNWSTYWKSDWKLDS